MAIQKVIDLKLSAKDAEKELKRINDILEEQEGITIKLQREQFELERQLKATPKNALSAQKDLRKQLDHVKDSIKDQSISVKELKFEQKNLRNSTKDLTKGVKENSGAMGALNANTGLLDSLTGGAVSKIGKFKGVLKTATLGFKSLRLAAASTGLGLLVVAIAAVTSAFKTSEAGQNKFKKILGVIGSVIGNLTDVLSNLGDKIISAFKNPQQAIIKLKDLIVTNITNRISSLIDTFGFLGSAIKKVFSGDFKGAMDDAKKAGNSYIDTAKGVKNTIDKISNAGKNLAKGFKEDAKAAQNIADIRAAADIKARKLITERAKADQDIARLREKAVDKEKFSAKERIKFLEEAGKINTDIVAKEVEVAEMRLKAKLAENELSKSTKEDLDEAAELEAEVIALKTKQLNIQKELTTELQASKNEAKAAIKATVDAEKKAAADKKKLAEDEAKRKAAETKKYLADQETLRQKNISDAMQLSLSKKRFNAEEIEDEALRLERLKEIDLEEQAFQAERLQRIIDNAKAGSEEKIAAQIALDNHTEQSRQQNATSDDAIADAKKEQSDQEVEWAEMTQEQKTAIYTDGLNNLSTILGKETAAGKAAAVAKASINTYDSAVGAYNSLAGIPIVGPALGAIAAVVAIKAGMANVKAILKTKTPGGGGGGGGAPSVSTPAAPPSKPPAFNVVRSSSKNQLAEVINNQTGQQTEALGGKLDNQTESLGNKLDTQSQMPVKAYVVSTEVSGQQELDRKIGEGSEF